MSLAALKNRGQKRIDGLLDQSKKSEYTKDSRFWSPTLDKAGNSFSVIRFLPEKEDEENFGYVKLYRHYIDGDNGKYVENCLTTIGQNDPVQTHVNALWKLARAGDTDAEAMARKLGRKARYYANILVLEDKEVPENEGKVFIWEFGQKVFDKLEAMYQPESEYEDKRDPWDIFGQSGGANFKVKLRKVGGFTNYDLCGFDSPSPIMFKGKAMKDDEIEEMLSKRHALDPIIAQSNFKSFSELEKLFEAVNSPSTTTKIAPRAAARQQEVRKPQPSREQYDADEDLIQGIIDDEDD